MRFITVVYHCNIGPSNGVVYLDILRDQWSGALGVEKVLVCIQWLLANPNPGASFTVTLCVSSSVVGFGQEIADSAPCVADSPCGSAEIGKMLQTDKARHDAIARQWARTYADADADDVKLCLARQRLAFAQLGERDAAASRIILHYDLEMEICARLGEGGARPSYAVYKATAKEAEAVIDERVALDERVAAQKRLWAHKPIKAARTPLVTGRAAR